MLRRTSLVAAGMLLLASAPADAAVLPYRFDKIAETGGTYADLGLPALNDNGIAAFAARTGNAGMDGAYYGNHVLVQPVSGISGIIRPTVDINNVGQVTYAQPLAPPQGQTFGDTGVYRWTSGSGTVEIGRAAGAIEESLSGGPVINNAGTVAFSTSSTIQSRAVRGNGFGPSQTVGSSAGNIGGSSINNAGNLAYTSFGNNFGTFLLYNNGTDPARTVVSVNGFGPNTMFTDPDTGVTGPFNALRGFDAANSDRVVFSARWNNTTDAFYLWDDGVISKIAGTDGPIGVPSVNDLGVVAGLVSGNGPDRLAIFEDGVEGTLIAEGWAFDGSTITDLRFSPEGFNNLNQVAFQALLADGRLVNVITQLPEPGAAGMLLVGAGGMLVRRRRAH